MSGTATARPRVVVVQHEDDCPPGLVAEALERAGLHVDVVRPDLGESLPDADDLGDDHDPAGLDGLVVLGGRMGAGDDADHPWLAPTRDLIAAAVAADVPTLGICLGHQLAARACGGTVHRNPAGKTIALRPWSPTEEGAEDPLTSALRADEAVLHWNGDVVETVPPRATVLARTPDGAVQALRLGARAWGVQFHPEVTPAIVEGWPEEGNDPEDERVLVAQVRERYTVLAPVWERLLDRFAALVSS